MLECTSIRPETTHQKLESQRFYLTLLTMDLYVNIWVKICVGVASTNPQFSRKLSKLRRSFSLCNCVTYTRIFWQCMNLFHLLYRNAIFGKNTKVIVHGFVKIWGSEVGNRIKPFYVRIYVYMSWNYTPKIRVTAFLFNPFNYGFVCEYLSENLCRCGFN